jgi:hypothetical protein
MRTEFRPKDDLSAAWAQTTLPLGFEDDGVDLKTDPSLEEWALDVYDMEPEAFNQRGLANTAKMADDRLLEDLEDADTAELSKALADDAADFSDAVLRS